MSCWFSNKSRTYLQFLTVHYILTQDAWILHTSWKLKFTFLNLWLMLLNRCILFIFSILFQTKKGVVTWPYCPICHCGCQSVKRQTYQIQHRFDNIPLANLSHLDQAGKNREFRFDIPDWNRWIHNPDWEHHKTWTALHRCLSGGSSGGCSSRLLMTRSGLSVRERHLDRHRHRSLACHFHAKRTASDVSPARNSVNALKRPKQKKKKREWWWPGKLHKKENKHPVRQKSFSGVLLLPWCRCRSVNRGDWPAVCTRFCRSGWASVQPWCRRLPLHQHACADAITEPQIDRFSTGAAALHQPARCVYGLLRLNVAAVMR